MASGRDPRGACPAPPGSDMPFASQPSVPYPGLYSPVTSYHIAFLRCAAATASGHAIPRRRERGLRRANVAAECKTLLSPADRGSGSGQPAQTRGLDGGAKTCWNGSRRPRAGRGAGRGQGPREPRGWRHRGHGAVRPRWRAGRGAAWGGEARGGGANQCVSRTWLSPRPSALRPWRPGARRAAASTDVDAR